MMGKDVPATEVAKEFGTDVADVLNIADLVIEHAAQQGVEAARGLTTRTRRVGDHHVTDLSAPLAERIRQHLQEERDDAAAT